LGKKQSLWQSILADGSRSSQEKNSTILMLGRHGVGKRSLLRALQKIGNPDDPSSGDNLVDPGVCALDFAYLNVRNLEDPEFTDVLARANVWILEDSHFRSMIQSRVTPEDLKAMAVLICLDMKEPWTMVEDMRAWSEVVQGDVAHILNQLPLKEQDELRQKLAAYIQSYQEHLKGHKDEQHDQMGFTRKRTINVDEVSLKEGESLLGEGMLTFNIGIPVIVVVCQSENYTALEDRATQGHLDIIQAHVRDAALPYGAALFYTSTKDPRNAKNVDELYRYLTHRLYDFPFKHHADTVSKDALMIPTGFDSKKHITEFAAKTVAQGLERPFETIIQKPTSKLKARDSEPYVEIESMAAFLAKAQHALHASGPGGKSLNIKHESKTRDRTTTRADAVGGAGGGGDRRVTPMSGGNGAPAPGQQQDNAQLANFFKTLLDRGQQGGSGSSSGKMPPTPTGAAATQQTAGRTSNPQSLSGEGAASGGKDA